MLKTIRLVSAITVAAVLLIISARPLLAVGRTTPVEVVNTPMVGIDPNNSTVKAVQVEPWYMNILGTPNFNIANSPTVKIDGTTNTVKAAQSGTWNIGVSSMPTVNVNTHAVSQSGTWNVGVTGTPSVAQSGTWNVGISSTANTVKLPAVAQVVQLWTNGTDVAPGSMLSSPQIYTSGFRRAHFIMVCTPASDQITASLLARMGDGVVAEIGKARWLSAASGFAQGGSFAMEAHVLSFSCDVISDLYQIRIRNGSTQTATIYGTSYVYLTD